MKYIYNPLESGAPIKDFTFKFKKYAHAVGQIMQYEDDVAEEIKATFGYLQDLTRSEVDKTLKKLSDTEAPFKCEFCDKRFTEQIALTGHGKTHKDEMLEKEAPLDPSIVPVAGGEQIGFVQNPNIPQMQMQANPSKVAQQYNNVTNGDTEIGNDPQFYDAGSYEKHGN